MTSAGEDHSSNILTAVQVQLGEIKGILNTIVTEHARRITGAEQTNMQLRYDLDKVKTESTQAVVDMGDKVGKSLEAAKESGYENLRKVQEQLTTNTNHIADIKNDVIEVKDKQNGAVGRIVLVLSPVVAIVALIWNMVGGKLV